MLQRVSGVVASPEKTWYKSCYTIVNPTLMPRTPISKRQRANIEQFKREGPKVYARMLATLGLPKTSWWLDPHADWKKEQERMRNSAFGLRANYLDKDSAPD